MTEDRTRLTIVFSPGQRAPEEPPFALASLFKGHADVEIAELFGRGRIMIALVPDANVPAVRDYVESRGCKVQSVLKALKPA